MSSADSQLIEQIQQATRGGSRVLCTLARRGKTIERDEPQRAQFLLSAVRSHPFYKGGRLAFDMLEIEDLMLEGPLADSMSAALVAEVLSAGLSNLAAVLRRIGSNTHGGRVPAEDAGSQPDSLVTDATHVPEAASVLPRVSFGGTHNGHAGARQVSASHEDAEGVQHEPALRSSDYLYDYVVLGFLDVIGRTRMDL